jgi:hypothetical protein
MEAIYFGHYLLILLLNTMIPNNQLWFNNKINGLPPIETGWEYVATYNNLAHSLTERDGNVIFETGGKIRCIGGWNPAKPGTGWGLLDSTNQQWETSDGGVTWTQIANAPWSGRHNFGHGFRNDGKFWIWGSDVAGVRDVWTYDAINGWVQVTADWGLTVGDRVGYEFCVHNDYMYIFGGNVNNDIYKSNDGINWTYVGTLPIVGSNGYACSHRGYIYIIIPNVGGTEKRIWRSTNGASWTQMTSLPASADQTTTWSRLFSWADRLWYFAGSGAGNMRGIWMTDDEATTWKKHPSFFMLATHAQGINTFGNDLYQIAGNASPSSNKLYRVAYSTLTDSYVHSLRKAVPSYSGAAIRVRRSSDSTEQDIGFIGNDLDTAALATFVGAGTGYIRTFYNQTGGTNLVQTNTALQPIIRAGGTTYTQNGKPAIYFDTTSKYLTYGGTINLTSKYTISAVMNLPSGLRQFGYGGSNSYLFYNNTSGSNVAHNNGATPPFTTFTSGFFFSNSAQKLVEVYRNRNTSWVYENAVKYEMPGNNNYPTISNTRSIFDTNQTLIQIGGELGGQSFAGYLQELNIKIGVVEPDSNTAIQADINGYWGVY